MITRSHLDVLYKKHINSLISTRRPSHVSLLFSVIILSKVQQSITLNRFTEPSQRPVALCYLCLPTASFALLHFFVVCLGLVSGNRAQGKTIRNKFARYRTAPRMQSISNGQAYYHRYGKSFPFNVACFVPSSSEPEVKRINVVGHVINYPYNRLGRHMPTIGLLCAPVVNCDEEPLPAWSVRDYCCYCNS